MVRGPGQALLLCAVVAVLLLIFIHAATVPPKAQVPPTLGYTISPKDTVIVLSPHLRLRVTFAQ